jgi:hypothetical protein
MLSGSLHLRISIIAHDLLVVDLIERASNGDHFTVSQPPMATLPTLEHVSWRE